MEVNDRGTVTALSPADFRATMERMKRAHRVYGIECTCADGEHGGPASVAQAKADQQATFAAHRAALAHLAKLSKTDPAAAARFWWACQPDSVRAGMG